MKISTKGRYGLAALLVLCLESDGGHVSLKNIADKCGISEAYTLQIFLILRRSGIVDSVRGAQGGYRLGRDPAEITVLDVLTALEGPLAPVYCVEKDCKDPCVRQDYCVTHLLWKEMLERLNALTNSITLTDLAEYYRSMNRAADYEDYCI